MSVKFHEKLAALTENMNRSDIDRAAGLALNSVSNLINKPVVPKLDRALRIARALGVSLEWLADDSAGLPAVQVPPLPEIREMLGPDGAKKHDLLMIETGDVAKAYAAAVHLFSNSSLEKQNEAIGAVSRKRAKSRR